MDSFSTAFARELAARIKEAADREREALELGVAINLLDAYKEKVGRLYAYQQVLADFMPAAEREVQNPQKGT
jgi:hypothetical protein